MRNAELIEAQRFEAAEARVKAEKINEKLSAETSELEEALARGDEMVREMETKVKTLESEKQKADRQVCIQPLILATT